MSGLLKTPKVGKSLHFRAQDFRSVDCAQLLDAVVVSTPIDDADVEIVNPSTESGILNAARCFPITTCWQSVFRTAIRFLD